MNRVRAFRRCAIADSDAQMNMWLPRRTPALASVHNAYSSISGRRRPVRADRSVRFLDAVRAAESSLTSLGEFFAAGITVVVRIPSLPVDIPVRAATSTSPELVSSASDALSGKVTAISVANVNYSYVLILYLNNLFN